MIRQLLKKASSGYPFGKDDFFQQIVGSAVLTAPFLFTEEVWRLAGNMSSLQSALFIGITLVLGHGILYIAEMDRDWNRERKLFGFTLRYISLMGVSLGTIVVLVFMTSAPETFNAGWFHTFKTISLISVFSVLGAATADSLI